MKNWIFNSPLTSMDMLCFVNTSSCEWWSSCTRFSNEIAPCVFCWSHSSSTPPSRRRSSKAPSQAALSVCMLQLKALCNMKYRLILIKIVRCTFQLIHPRDGVERRGRVYLLVHIPSIYKLLLYAISSSSCVSFSASYAPRLMHVFWCCWLLTGFD